MTRSHFSGLAVALSLVLGPAAARAETVKIAVMQLKAPGFDREVVENLYGIMVAEIDSVEGMQVVSRDEIEAMLGFEQQKSLLGCDDTSCLAEIAGALGVDKVVAGKVGKVGNTYVININMIDHASARVEKRLVRTVKGEVDILIVTIAEVGRELVGASAQATVVPEPSTATAAPEQVASPAGGELEPESEGFSLWSVVPPVVMGLGGVGLLAGGTLGVMSGLSYAAYQDAGSQTAAEQQHDLVRGQGLSAGIVSGVGLLVLGAGFAMMVF